MTRRIHAAIEDDPRRIDTVRGTGYVFASGQDCADAPRTPDPEARTT